MSAADYRSWACDDAPVWHELTSPQADLLRLLARHVNDAGECFVRLSKLAAARRVKVRTIQRGLRELERRGLLVTTHRKGRSSVYRLLKDKPPAAQMMLGLDPSEALSDGPPTPDADVTPDVRDPRHQCQGESRHWCRPEVEGEVEASPSSNARESEQGRHPALPERFEEVMRILAEAHDLVVNDMAVASALDACPESSGYDHVQAAKDVRTAARERLTSPIASTALRKQLEFQWKDRIAGTQPAAAVESAIRAPRDHGRQRRRANAATLRPWQQSDPVDEAAVYARGAAVLADHPDDGQPF